MHTFYTAIFIVLYLFYIWRTLAFSIKFLLQHKIRRLRWIFCLTCLQSTVKYFFLFVSTSFFYLFCCCCLQWKERCLKQNCYASSITVIRLYDYFDRKGRGIFSYLIAQSVESQQHNRSHEFWKVNVDSTNCLMKTFVWQIHLYNFVLF